MIKITIEKITETVRTETQHKLVKSTPTEITEKSDYGNRSVVKCIEEYAPVEITVKDTSKTTLLIQEIKDDADFNLKAVIGAINVLGGTQ